MGTSAKVDVPIFALLERTLPANRAKIALVVELRTVPHEEAVHTSELIRLLRQHDHVKIHV